MLYSEQISIYRYTTLYPSMKPVYLGIYAYEQVQDRICAYERCILAYMSVYTRIYAYVTLCKNMHDSWIRTGNLMHIARLLWPLRHQRWYQKCVSFDICLLNCCSILSLGAFWLMSDVLCWVGSTPAPAMMRGFAKRGFQVSASRAGSARHWVPCDPNLSQPAISESESLWAVGLGKTILLPQMCTGHKTRCKTYKNGLGRFHWIKTFGLPKKIEEVLSRTTKCRPRFCFSSLDR